MAYFWLIVIVLALIAEAATVQLIAVWFAVGGVGGLISFALGASVPVQIGVFILLSAACLVISRPYLKKFARQEKSRLNADRVVGEEALVIAEINNDHAEGQVRVLGSIWSARSVDGSIIPAGQKVKVERIEGVKLIVSTIDRSEQN